MMHRNRRAVGNRPRSNRIDAPWLNRLEARNWVPALRKSPTGIVGRVDFGDRAFYCCHRHAMSDAGQRPRTLARAPSAMVVRAETPFRTLQDCVAFAKANPDK